jgi:hypothetical protein
MVAKFDGPVDAGEVDVLVAVEVLETVADVVGTELVVDKELVVEIVLWIEDVDVDVDDVEERVEEVDDDPCCALACIANVMYPPSSLQNVRNDAWIPVVVGENTNGTTREAPAAKVDPTAGKLDEVYPLPTVDEVTLT